MTNNVSRRPDVRAVGLREMLAIDSSVLRAGPKSFFWLWSPPARRNERYGPVAVVFLRGPLEHHASWGDSYDSLVERVSSAISGSDVVADWEESQSWRQKPNPPECPEPTPPTSLVVRIDSPGGVVAGLNETVAKLATLAKNANVKLVAYVDEMAASAAYAIACACDEIVCPRSAILGSIGVISTMVDQTAADAEAGLKFVTITSGDRKADGHPHVPIEDDAIEAERARVMELAGQFWGIVAKSRGLTLEKIEGYQAGIFLGKEAKRVGLADRVQGWDALLARLTAEAALDKPNESSSGSGVTKYVTPRSSRMDLKALITKTKAAIAKEDDPAKLAALAADLSAYKKTEKHVEHTKTEEGDDEDEEDEAAEAKGNETDRSDEPEDDEDDDEKDGDAKKSKKTKKASGSESDEKKAMLAVYQAACAATGKTGKGAAGAIAALLAEAKEVPALRERVAKIEQAERKNKRQAMIDTAKAERKITPAEAKTLATKSLDFVTDFLDMRPNALVRTSDEELFVPSGKENADLGPAAMTEIDSALASLPESATKEQRESMRARLVENARKAMAQTNGAAEGRH